APAGRPGRPAARQLGPVRPAGTRRGPAGMGVDGDGAARLAAAAADHGGGYRRADQAAEPRRLGRGTGRYAPGDAVAGGGAPADQRAQLPAAKDRRGTIAVRSGHPAPWLGLVGRAAPVRRDVPVLGRIAAGGPAAAARPPRPP